jgi:hypothetical protein
MEEIEGSIDSISQNTPVKMHRPIQTICDTTGKPWQRKSSRQNLLKARKNIKTGEYPDAG